MTLLLPRLSKSGVAKILAAHGPEAPPALEQAAALATYSDLVSFAPSGGTRSPDAAYRVAEGLREIAEQCGFPKLLSRAKFDRDSAVYLAGHPALQSGEALRNDVWAFIGTIVVPDLVGWRFKDLNKARFEGGVRNAFQRLWLRGKALDRGEDHPERWRLALSLPEDAAVQIVERPSLGGRRRITKTLGEGWSRKVQTAPLGEHEQLMRTATKILRLQNEVVDLVYLSEDLLSCAVDAAFAKARSTLSEPGIRPVF